MQSQEPEVVSKEETVTKITNYFPNLKLVVAPSPVLNQSSEEVKDFGAPLQELLESMTYVMKKLDGLGLSAIQVNVPAKVFILDTILAKEIDGGHLVFINPRIENLQGQVEINEGCLSFPGLSVKVNRAETLTIHASDKNNNPFTCNLTGLAAIAVQHEYDHLEGMTFLDKLSKLKKDMYKARYNKSLRATKRNGN